MCSSKRHRKSGHNRGSAMKSIVDKYSEEDTPMLNEGLLYCLNCGQTFNSDNIKYCDNCGLEIKVCPISRNKFRTGDSFAQCPKCQTVFHYHHLTDWLNSDNRCPYCRKNLNFIHKGIVGINSIYRSSK